MLSETADVVGTQLPQDRGTHVGGILHSSVHSSWDTCWHLLVPRLYTLIQALATRPLAV